MERADYLEHGSNPGRDDDVLNQDDKRESAE